jgi:hypothetical protein
MTAVDRAIETYLARLRAELVAAGAGDADDLVAEIRGLLEDAVATDPEAATAELARLGDPSDLARGILAERGLDAAPGISPGVWWRLGIAAPIDIVIGLALPLAAALPLYVLARFGSPRFASITLALAFGAVALAWPFLLWRPWRSGGRTLTPGMALTGLAVVRAPGSWRLVTLAELAATGLAPRRRLASSVAVALVAVVLLAATATFRLESGESWLTSFLAIRGATSAVPPYAPTPRELTGRIGVLYGPDAVAAEALAVPDAIPALRALRKRAGGRQLGELRIGEMQRVADGVFRVEVVELPAADRPSATRTMLTFGQRRWLVGEKAAGGDWALVRIEQ